MFRITEAELAYIEGLAAKEALSLSDLVRSRFGLDTVNTGTYKEPDAPDETAKARAKMAAFYSEEQLKEYYPSPEVNPIPGPKRMPRQGLYLLPPGALKFKVTLRESDRDFFVNLSKKRLVSIGNLIRNSFGLLPDSGGSFDYERSPEDVAHSSALLASVGIDSGKFFPAPAFAPSKRGPKPSTKTPYVLQPESEWTEEDGNVLWWHLPICEPPMVGQHFRMGGQRLNGEQVECERLIEEGWLTHWSRIPEFRKMTVTDGAPLL